MMTNEIRRDINFLEKGRNVKLHILLISIKEALVCVNQMP